MTGHERREMAYWLTLAFLLEREPRRGINGLVLTADRKAHLRLLDLVRMDSGARPPDIARYASTLDHLLEAEGKVSAQAFIIDRLLSMGGRLVPITDPMYPPHLAHRFGPERSPTLLTVIGNPDLWKTPGVAISGSRKSGPAGLAFAREVGRAVAAAGEVVVCGLAAGVDREALEGALDAGGSVLGIAAEGLLQSRWARRREVREGRFAIVSEFAPDDAWTPGRAMARNRTIAGFSSALVIADCVASGGTTDQLEVHREAGLRVYVRRGPGEGALVDELCRRPGVTPWYWRSGSVMWPPLVEDTTPESVGAGVQCEVTLSADRLEIHVDAPRQLTLDSVFDSIRVEYDRATKQTGIYPATETQPRQGKVSEELATYGASRPDPVVAAIGQAGSRGMTARDLQHATGLTAYRVRKRLDELVDARLVSKSGHRYYDPTMIVDTPLGGEAVTPETKSVGERANSFPRPGSKNRAQPLVTLGRASRRHERCLDCTVLTAP